MQSRSQIVQFVDLTAVAAVGSAVVDPWSNFRCVRQTNPKPVVDSKYVRQSSARPSTAGLSSVASCFDSWLFHASMTNQSLLLLPDQWIGITASPIALKFLVILMLVGRPDAATCMVVALIANLLRPGCINARQDNRLLKGTIIS